jgi:hypothetical protein
MNSRRNEHVPPILDDVFVSKSLIEFGRYDRPSDDWNVHLTAMRMTGQGERNRRWYVRKYIWVVSEHDYRTPGCGCIKFPR